MITHYSANPANSANALGGSVNHKGYQSLPSNSCGSRESVRLFTGEISRRISLVSVPSLIEGFEFIIGHFAHDTGTNSLGHKWRHNFEMRIDPGVSLVTVTGSDGSLYDFIPDGSGGWKIDIASTTHVTHELTNPSGTIWEVKILPKGLIYRFDNTALSGYPSTAGRLTEIEDRHGNVMTMHYTSGKLTSVEEPQGREITFAYTGDLLTSVTGPMSDTTTFTYSVYDNLTSISGPEGCTVSFEYAQEGNHRITAVTDARGNTTRYGYEGEGIGQILYPDGSALRYRYLRGDQRPLENLSDSDTVRLDTTLVTMPDGAVFEYRFDPAGNLLRSISPSGHNKKYVWNSKHNLVYANEGFELAMSGRLGPADNPVNKRTRYTVNERGDVMSIVDPTGLGDSFEYDSEGRLLASCPGRFNIGVQGAWPGNFGADGIILCGFNDDASDRYLPPSYLSSTLATAITNGNGSGGDTYVGAHFTGLKAIDPRAPVAGDGSIKAGVGHWTQSGSAALGAVFKFAINLTTSQSFNLSLYSNSVDHGHMSYIPLRHYEQYGRDIEFEVQDVNGVQKLRMLNNRAGVWATFPVQGDASNPVLVTMRATGDNNQPVLSAVAFDPFHDRRTLYTYTSGNLTRITDGLGNETDYVYNADGTMASVTDARGKTTTYSYLDANKNRTRITDHDSNETEFEYDDNGNVTKVTDANLNETLMTYDGKNRLLTVTDALLGVTTMDRDGNGNVLSVVDAKNRETVFSYDTLNRLVETQNELGHVAKVSYDANGRLSSMTNPRGYVTRYSYNSDGNLTAVETPDGERTTMAYDFLHRLAALTGPNGNQDSMELVNLVGASGQLLNESFENKELWRPPYPAHWDAGYYGSLGQDTTESLTGDTSTQLGLADITWQHHKLQLPEGAVFVARAHAKRDQVELVLKATLRDRNAGTSTVEHRESLSDPKFQDWGVSDALKFIVPSDAQTTITNPTMANFSAELAIAHDKTGWLDDVELFMLSQANHYDKAGRLKSMTTPDGARVSQHRDHLGRVTSVQDPRGLRTEMAYDSLDRVVSLTKPSGETLEFAYNEVGALVSFKDGLAQEVLFDYDNLNRLATITYPDTTTELFSYDAVGNLEQYTDNAGVARQFAYDELNRLVNITYADTTTVEMTYDQVGNLLSLTERNGDLLEYEYDDIDRLVTVTRTKDTGNTTPEWELHYTYDKNGNLTSLSDGVGELWSLSATSTYGSAHYGEDRYSGGLDAMDRPKVVTKAGISHAEFQYDHQGRRVRTGFANGVSTQLGFDIVGRPLTMATAGDDGALLDITYRYDQASNRIGQVSGNDTIDYKVDDDGKLVGECINRMVLTSESDFAKGSLEKVQLGDSLQLMALDDSFAGDELDCDRWRVASTTTSSSLNILGAETRQDDGLHFRFPRGYSNRVQFRDRVPLLNDDFGLASQTFYNALEHRVPLTGDFDVRVDLTDFMSESNYTYAALHVLDKSAYIFEQSPAVTGYYGPSVRYSNGTVTFFGSSGTTAPSLPTKLRLVRSGSTITGYIWDGSTWVNPSGWSTSAPTGPMGVYLITHTPAGTSATATFENFVYNHSTSPGYASSGTYLSPVYDAGRSALWQNLSWAETLPSGTNVEMQVAFSDDPEGPWTYLGPDGTSGTRFTTPAGESVGASKISRYARVKVYLTGNVSATPSLDSLELSYLGGLTSRYQSYGFDAAGNLTNLVTKTDSSLVQETRTYDDLNQIVDNEIDDGSPPVTWTYTHDTNGNLVSKTDGTDTWDYAWDDENRLTSVKLNSATIVSYVYDSVSRLLKRVEGGTTTLFGWDGWDLIKEVKSGTVNETTNYLVARGDFLAFERGGDFFYLHGDGLNSAQLVTDENGGQVGRFIYGAWGEELYASESVPGILENRFVGGLGCRKDAATGLVYMRHRWYNPELQRFISRDPIGLASGFNTRIKGYPQKKPGVDGFRVAWDANSYGYSFSAPNNFSDHLGLKPGRDPFQKPDLTKIKGTCHKPPKQTTCPSTRSSPPLATQGWEPDPDDLDVVFYPPMIMYGITKLFFDSNIGNTRGEACRQLFTACLDACLNPVNSFGMACSPLGSEDAIICLASCYATLARCVSGKWPEDGVVIVPR